MKSFIVIFSIFLFIEIQHAQSREIKRNPTASFKGLDGKKITDIFQATVDTETSDNAGNVVEGSSAEPNQKSPQERVDEMKEKAAEARAAAMEDIRRAYHDIQNKADQTLEMAQLEHISEKEAVSQKFKKANKIMSALFRNHANQWGEMTGRAHDEYQQMASKGAEKKREAEREREATWRTADEQFGKAYAELEKNKKLAESEHKDALAKGKSEYENALKLAEEAKDTADREFWNAANKYKTMPAEEWEKAKAKFDAATKAYEEATQKANNEWQAVLDAAGVGKQYEEALGKAFAKLLEGHEKANSIMVQLYDDSEEDARKAEEMKEEVMQQIRVEQAEAEREYEEAREKAANELEDANRKIQQKWEMNQFMAEVELSRARVELDKKIAEINKEYKQAIAEAAKMMNKTEKAAERLQTMPQKVAQTIKRGNQPQRRRQSNRQ